MSERKWTEETELAFVLALELRGRVDLAAAAIGRAPTTCYQRRLHSPAFAQRWAAAVAALDAKRREAAAAATAVPLPPEADDPGLATLRARRDGWTAQRQRAFQRALADTGNVTAAAARVGISRTSVQRLMKRSPAFRDACAQALADGGPSATEVLRQRAIHGWDEPVVHGGQVTAYKRVHSEKLLAEASRQEQARDEVAALRRDAGDGRRATSDETDAAILRRIAAIRKAELRAEAAVATQLLREGKVP